MFPFFLTPDYSYFSAFSGFLVAAFSRVLGTNLLSEMQFLVSVTRSEQKSTSSDRICRQSFRAPYFHLPAILRSVHLRFLRKHACIQEYLHYSLPLLHGFSLISRKSFEAQWLPCRSSNPNRGQDFCHYE